MGQEGGKPAWSKLAGGYEAYTHRRCRRHNYVDFRPPWNSQDRDEHQHNEDCKQLGLEDVLKVESLYEPVLENTGMGQPVCRSVSNRTLEVNTSSFSLFSWDLEGSQNSGKFVNPYENSKDLAEFMSGGHNNLSSPNAIAYVNIDSYEPDSSDGEEDDAQHQFSSAREEAGAFQETLDNTLSDLEKSIESSTDLRSPFSALNHSVCRECCEETGPMSLVRDFSVDSDLAYSNNRTFKSSTGDQAILKSNVCGANYKTQQITEVNVGAGTSIIANELNANGGNTDEGNSPELVVRPKIRKQNTANPLERDQLLPNADEEQSDSWGVTEIAQVQGHAEWALRNSREVMSSSMFCDSREYEGHKKNIEIGLNKSAAAQERKNVLDNSILGDEFEDFNKYFSMSHKDEDSPECSDGEWPAAVPACLTAMVEEQSSSDESLETLPFREECDLKMQSSSSSNGVEDFFFQGREQTSLEEGEICWLQYQQELESSSDEEDNSATDFVHPTFFLLDGNNNLEDDFSVGEDLDVEWRVLEEFGDGLGLAQAIPYMNPQFLTFMALEEHIQQVVEMALAHLESIVFDVEQAHPPATKETIDCLPQIVITEDHDGQEQCCTICCGEYEKDEVITELPCHHLFHKPCVTRWLQESATCPVCRHVLAPVLPGAAAATVSFRTGDDSASSVDSATGGSN